MEPLLINAADDTPHVILDSEKGIFNISGKSMPEDVAAFYEPIIQWVEAYSASPKAKTVVALKMDYFNTASSKLLLDVLIKFEEIAQNGSEVLIQWNYHSNDEEMKEAGEEYADIVEIPFEFVEY